MTAPDDPRPRNRSRLPRRRELRTRLRPELLEDRVTPATFVVNSLADGAPVADGQLTLREAVTAAVTNAPSGDAPAGSPAALDTITFAAAVAGGVINLNPAQGDLDLTGGGALSITGPRPGDPGGITVSGQGSVRVFNIVNAGTVSIADLTATAGSTLAAGGAILVQNSQVTLTSVAATASKAGTDGGGIAVLGIGSKLTLDASLVSGNRAGQDGGGIYIETGASAKISNTTVIGNILEADFDGAGIDNNGTTTITDSTIAGNFGSTVFSFGGGVENQGTLTISGTAIYGNAAARGGGISGSAGTLTVTNSTVAYNRAFASDGGGGIIVASGTATVVNSTVVGNADTSDAPDGAGGIAATSEAIVNLLNSIVSLNFAGPASANENVDPADLDTNVNNFLGGDPKLGPLEDNGGPTLTMLPFPGSPVIDSGANVNATDDGTAGGTPLATDQRGAGFPRIVGGTVDRGAAEFSPTAPTPAPAPPVTPTFVVNSLLDGAPAADGKLTLREAVTAATTNAPSGDAPAGTAGLDVITFDPSLFGGTINLNAAQGELVLDGGGDVEIVGLGGVAGGITISGQGAVRVFNIAATAGAVTLRDLTITRGNAGTGFGGGVQNLGPDTTLTNVTISDSKANFGGGLFNAKTVTIERSRILGNVADSNGGGLNNDNNTGGVMIVADTLVSGNRASNGGGLFNFTQGTLTVLRSTVVGNFSKLEGGGIRNVGNTADALRVLNSTIAFNNSDGGSGGGGISTVNGTVRVVNTTVYGNSDTSNNAGGAGGIDRSGGTLVLANSIVALNFAAPATTQENVDPAEINTDTDNFLGGDPRLGPLRDNGGPTFTLAPLPGSPVIDAGTNAAATDTGAAGGTPLATDQRGASRVFDGDSDGTATVDQGAVEFTLSPVIAFPGGALAVAEGDPAAVLDPGATVTVPSGVGLGGGNLTVEITAGATSADLLGVRNEGTGAGQIGVSNTSITFGGVAIGTFAGGTGGTLLVITFNASATPEAVQALLRNITFDTTALAASTAPRTVRAVLTAAGGIASNAAQKTVNVTPAPVTVTVNQAAGQADPTNAQPVLFTVVFSEPVSGFDASDVTVGGTATGGTAAVAESGPMDGTTYTVSVSGLTSAGTVTVSVPAGAAVDTAGNPSEASTSTDNTVTFQTSPPVPPVPPPPPPPVGQNSTDRFGVGLGIGGGGAVTVHTGDGGAAFAIDAFAPAPPGGVRVAVADVTGDGVADVIAGAGPGALPQVKVFDGATQALLITIDAFEPSFLGGVYVAAGDLDGDGKADVVITPDEGGGPRVRVFRGGDFAQLNDFFGIEDLAFRGGARAALADVSGDGRIDLLVAAGFGGGPRIAVFDGVSVATGSTTPEKLVPDFFVFETTLRNGVFIAGGDITGDGFAEVIAGGGPGGGPRVFALSGRELVESGAQVAAANFFAGDVANRGGIRIVAKDFDGDGRADLVAGAGTDAPPLVTRYSGVNIPAEGTPPELDSFFAGPPNFLGGVFVG